MTDPYRVPADRPPKPLLSFRKRHPSIAEFFAGIGLLLSICASFWILTFGVYHFGACIDHFTGWNRNKEPDSIAVFHWFIGACVIASPFVAIWGFGIVRSFGEAVLDYWDEKNG